MYLHASALRENDFNIYFFLYNTGAVYQAARLSKGFRVKNFVVKDANVYPIEVRNYADCQI
jgi:hypothetical protein